MQYDPPFLLVDADTNRPMRPSRFTHSIEALNWGMRAYAGTDKDFKILDRHLREVPASACCYIPKGTKQYRLARKGRDTYE